MRDYIALTKPKITWLILMSAGLGYFFGLDSIGGWPALLRGFLSWKLMHAVLGTGLLASGTAALNQWYEREADGKMRRTADRPIPAGRVKPTAALIFGIAISTAGFLDLAIAVNLLAASIGLLALLTYLLAYTPLKSRSWISTTVGAFPGALPPVIGFVAAAGSLSAEALALFAILFFWQFPHFYAIAWMYREDYARAGIVMLPVVEPDCDSTVRQMLVSSLLLIAASIVPAVLGMAGWVYAVGAILLGVWFLRSAVRIATERTRAAARNVLLASVVYLPVLYGLMFVCRKW